MHIKCMTPIQRDCLAYHTTKEQYHPRMKSLVIDYNRDNNIDKHKDNSYVIIKDNNVANIVKYEE